MNNVLKRRWAVPALCLSKMMKSLRKAYLHGETNELADLLEDQWPRVFTLASRKWTALNLCLWESSEI